MKALGADAPVDDDDDTEDEDWEESDDEGDHMFSTNDALAGKSWREA